MTRNQRFAAFIALCTSTNIIWGFIASFDRQIRGIFAAVSFRTSWYAFTNHDSAYAYWSLLTALIFVWVFGFGQLAISSLAEGIGIDFSTSGYLLLWVYNIAVTVAAYLLWHTPVDWITSTTGSLAVLAQIVTILTPLVIAIRWAWRLLDRSQKAR